MSSRIDTGGRPSPHRVAPPGTSPVPRLEWIDAARAFAVVAVVLFHVSLWHLSLAVTTHDAPVQTQALAEMWDELNSVVNGLRMPLLLGLSGLLMSRKFREGDGRGTWRNMATNAWLYVGWLLVYAAISVWLHPQTPHRITGVDDLLTQVVIPRTPLWYLIALVAYAGLCYVARGVRTAPLVAVLAVLSVVLSSVEAGGLGLWTKIGIFAVYFAIGARFADRIRDLAEHASLARLAAGVLVLVPVAALTEVVETPVAAQACGLLRNVLALIVAVTAIAWIVRWRPFSRAAAAVGRQTLSIYVIHVLLLQILVSLTMGATDLSWPLAASPVLVAAYPLVATLLLTAASIAIGTGLRRLGAGWLFGLPQFLTPSALRTDPPGVPSTR